MFKERRIGTFSIPIEWIENNKNLVKKLLSKVIVIKAEMELSNNTIVYTAISTKFRKLNEFSAIPTYLVTTDGEFKEDLDFIKFNHGDPFLCPICGAPGNLDLSHSAEKTEFENSIWWNSHTKSWECGECYLK